MLPGHPEHLPCCLCLRDLDHTARTKHIPQSFVRIPEHPGQPVARRVPKGSCSTEVSAEEISRPAIWQSATHLAKAAAWERSLSAPRRHMANPRAARASQAMGMTMKSTEMRRLSDRRLRRFRGTASGNGKISLDIFKPAFATHPVVDQQITSRDGVAGLNSETQANVHPSYAPRRPSSSLRQLDQARSTSEVSEFASRDACSLTYAIRVDCLNNGLLRVFLRVVS